MPPALKPEAILMNDPLAATLLASADPDTVDFMLRLTAWQDRGALAAVFGELPNVEPTAQRWASLEAEWSTEPLCIQAQDLRQQLQAAAPEALQACLVSYLEGVACEEPEDIAATATSFQMVADGLEIAAEA